MDKLNKLSVTEALDSLRKKEFTVGELVLAHVKAMESYSYLNSYVLENTEIALKNAKKADYLYQNSKNRKLEGIPIAIKDLFCTKGIRTTSCSKMLSNFVPTYESTVSQKMIDSGTIMLGKTNMDEMAMGSSNITSYFNSVINPWKSKNNDINLVPGGSSGGSAAAVASFCAMAALGSDTGGSTRQPAAFTGLVGAKPTYGRCSRWGMIAFASSLDQAGILTRNVKDSALLLENMMGFDPKDSTSVNKDIPKLVSASKNSIKGIKIGMLTDVSEIKGISDEVQKMWDDSIKIVQSEGGKIINIVLPNLKYALAAYYIISSAEASSNLARYDGIRYGYRSNKQDISLEELYSLSRSEGFGIEVKRRIMLGTYVLSAKYKNTYYLTAQKIRHLIKEDFKNAFSKVDVILLPTAPTAAFAIKDSKYSSLQMYLNDIFTIPASLAGLPCMSVPASLTKKDMLPLGMQIIASHFDEYNMIRVAAAIERANKNLNFIPRGF